MQTQALSRSRIVLLLLSLALPSGCDYTTYMDGHPPPDAQLVVSEVAIDSSRDSSGRTVRLSFRADWKIDSSDFRPRTYRIEFTSQQTSPPWLPGPRTTPLPGPVGTVRDTLSCKADTCFWTSPTIHVLAGLSNGEYLSVDRK